MSKFFDESMQGLLEAISIEKGKIPIRKKTDIPAPTFIASDKEETLIEEIVQLRKEKGISQSRLAELTGNKQQTIRYKTCKEELSMTAECCLDKRKRFCIYCTNIGTFF